jgi:hypothetical protein
MSAPSGYTNVRIVPPLKASCVAAAKMAATTRAIAIEGMGEKRSPATGATIPSSTISATSSQRGACWSGSPRSTVSRAVAWISAPAISSSPDVEVGCTSWSEGADGPITTTLSLNIPRGVRSWTACENGMLLIVPGGP